MPGPLEELEQAASAAGFATSRRIVRGEDRLDVEFPNGRGTRRVTYDAADAPDVLALGISRFGFLGDYDAVVDKDSGTIEARVGSLGTSIFGRSHVRQLVALPGVEVEQGDEAEDDDEPEAVASRIPENWRLVVTKGHVRMELSPASRDFSVLFYGAYEGAAGNTLKIAGLTASSHDETLQKLEVLGHAFFMDLDLRYGLVFGLLGRRALWSVGIGPPAETPPVFPENRYPLEPLALYRYGRSAVGLPLLEFLAYYQSIEYFFPIFSRDELFRQLQTELTDPRFDPRDDAALGRLVGIVTPAGRGSLSEREQLRATVRGCLDTTTLSDFISRNERIIEHFCARKQAIQGAPRLQPEGGQADLRDQVADRIYAIRCRIVHTRTGPLPAYSPSRASRSGSKSGSDVNSTS